MFDLSDFYSLITMICSIIASFIALISLIIDLIVHINTNKKQK